MGTGASNGQHLIARSHQQNLLLAELDAEHPIVRH
jgi:hypothetical protein